jgi:hypothetical protein
MTSALSGLLPLHRRARRRAVVRGWSACLDGSGRPRVATAAKDPQGGCAKPRSRLAGRRWSAGGGEPASLGGQAVHPRLPDRWLCDVASPDSGPPKHEQGLPQPRLWRAGRPGLPVDMARPGPSARRRTNTSLAQRAAVTNLLVRRLAATGKPGGAGVRGRGSGVRGGRGRGGRTRFRGGPLGGSCRRRRRRPGCGGRRCSCWTS